MVRFHYGPYDRFSDFEPFLSVPPRPPGAGFYPPALTREEFRAFIASHPEQAKDLISPFTVIRQEGTSLVSIPYHQFYAENISTISQELREASRIARHRQFGQYLQQRSLDVLTDDFYQGDTLWVGLSGNPIDAVIGPYEVYEDSLMGIKASYEGILFAINLEATDQIQSLTGDIDRIKISLQRTLGQELGVTDSRIRLSIANLLYSGGEARSANPAIAFNLPNDARVIEDVGSRQVILENVLESKFRFTVFPIILRFIADSSLDVAGAARIFLRQTIYHEISHSLGPHRITVDGEATSVNNRLGEFHSVLEEVKADAFGTWINLMLSDPELGGHIAEVYFADLLRSARFGLDHSHGGASAIQFNYLLDHGAFRIDGSGKTVFTDKGRVYLALVQLASDVIQIQSAGNRKRAEDFTAKYKVLSPELRILLERIADVPVDVRLSYSESTIQSLVTSGL